MLGDWLIRDLPGALALTAALAGVALLAATADAVVVGRRDGGVLRAALRPGRETVRLMRQRRRVTVQADTLLWRIGQAGLPVAALLMVAVIPVGDWVLLPLDVGVVWFNAMDVAVWALVWLAGWGANSAHSLVGAYRFLAQAMSYELPLMFALVAPAVAAASLDLREVVVAQDGLWFGVWMPVAFAVYLVGVAGFAVWGPLAPVIGADVGGGVLAEASGVDRLLFVGGRYALLAAGAAFAVPLFLGGGAGPWLAPWGWVLVKTVLVLLVLVAVGRRLPTLRPDLFLEVGWMVLLPAVLLQDLVVAVVAVGRF